MKRIFLAALLLIITGTLSAQGCKNYYYLMNNAEVEMTLYNGKGEAAGSSTYKVMAVKQEGSASVSDFTTSFKDNSGRELTGKGRFKCDGSNAYLDMQMNIPNLPQLQQMKMETGGNSFLSYPASLKVGQTLPDAAYEMKGSTGNVEMGLQCKTTNRKVAAKEKITSPAGSWDCFKITYNLSLKMNMMGMAIPVELSNIEWFAPGFGLVKTEAYKEGQLMSSMLLTGLKK